MEEYEIHLKRLVRDSEERFISYKQLLTDVFKDKEHFPLGGKAIEEYKDLLRWAKNQEESHLKELRMELNYFNQGLNPPYCYPEF